MEPSATYFQINMFMVTLQRSYMAAVTAFKFLSQLGTLQFTAHNPLKYRGQNFKNGKVCHNTCIVIPNTGFECT